jgi:hypothetical protein
MPASAVGRHDLFEIKSAQRLGFTRSNSGGMNSAFQNERGSSIESAAIEMLFACVICGLAPSVEIAAFALNVPTVDGQQTGQIGHPLSTAAAFAAETFEV